MWMLIGSRASPAHPRVCGENSRERDAVFFAEGSSPRVRGKPAAHLSRKVVHGLIPAYAGKTNGHVEVELSAQAHPRVCGENRIH